MDQLYVNIKQHRLRLKMSQDELAQKMGYKDRSAIAKMEKGLVDLPVSKIYLLSNLFEITPDELMGDIKKEDPPSSEPSLKQQPALTEQEQTLLELFRSLTPEQREMWIKLLSSH